MAIVRECDLLNAFDKNLNGEVLWRPDLFETAGKAQGLQLWWADVILPSLTQLAFSAVRITAKGSVALGGYEYCLHAHGMNLAKVNCSHWAPEDSPLLCGAVSTWPAGKTSLKRCPLCMQEERCIMVLLNSLDTDHLPEGCTPPPAPSRKFTRMKLLRGSCMMLQPLQERAPGEGQIGSCRPHPPLHVRSRAALH